MRFDLLARLYPAGWRARYGEEFLALLEQQPITPGTVLDIVLGALDARLHPQRHTQGGRFMEHPERNSILMVFCAYVGFVLAGLGFYATLDDSPFLRLARFHLGLQLSVLAVEAGAVIALIAVLVGGFPILRAAWRFTATSARRNLRLFAVPALFAVAILLGGGILLAMVSNRIPVGETVALGLFYFLNGLLLVAIIASAASVCLAVIRSEIRSEAFLLARRPATITTAAMGFMLVATVLWGLCALAADSTAFLQGHYGAFGANTAACWTLIVAFMLVTTGAAALSLRRARD
ncbi:MAG TPA: hypothetical protein VKT32_06275 [Chthonomonadaceae bacterium]|nr:hypothetical protein [Chthonomonadaceae bacterium]